MSACAETACAGSLLAPDLPAGAAATPAPPAIVLFGGSEFDRENGYGSGGFKIRPFRAAGAERLILIGAAGGGSWREMERLAPKRESDSRKAAAHLMAGGEWTLAGGTLGLFAGPEFFFEEARYPGGALARRERRFGARVQIDWWSHPTPATLLVGTVAAGTARREVWSRIAFGWRIGSEGAIWGYAGPEAVFYATRDSAKVRLGAHWSEFGAAGFRFRISGGASRETGRRASPYLALSGYRAF